MRSIRRNVSEAPLQTFEVEAKHKKRPFHLCKRTSPLIYRCEMHFARQEMGKLQFWAFWADNASFFTASSTKRRVFRAKERPTSHTGLPGAKYGSAYFFAVV